MVIIGIGDTPAIVAYFCGAIILSSQYLCGPLFRPASLIEAANELGRQNGSG